MSARVGLRRTAATAALVVASACSNTSGGGNGGVARSAPEIAFAQQTCVRALHARLIDLKTSRLDVFFSAALDGLVRCQAGAGLAHLPSREVARWLNAAGRPGRAHPPVAPTTPPDLARHPQSDDDRLAYQRRCIAFARRYLPAEIAHGGDDPDVAAAFVFNVVEQCDADAGFATIEPRDLAAMMQEKHIL